MASQPFSFTLDARELAKEAINRIRVGLGLAGLAALVIGVLITFWPGISATVLAMMLGIYWVVAGVGYLFVGIFSKGISGWSRVLDFIVTVVLVIGGVIVLANPVVSATTLAILLGTMLGVFWIIEGILSLVQSGDRSSRAWAIVFGIVSILAGISVLFIPLISAATLFLLAGVGLIVLGIFQIVRAFRFGHGVMSDIKTDEQALAPATI